MKTKHRELIISIVSLIVGALLSWFVAFVMPAKPVDLSKNSKSDLTCTLVYVRRLITKRTSDSRFKIVFEDKEIEDPYLLDICIKNTGSHAIREEDFRDDFVIAIEGGTMILSASVSESSNRYLEAEIVKAAKINGAELRIPSFFLNPNESFTLSIITDNKPTGIIHKSRIEDIPSLTIVNKPAEAKAKLSTAAILVPAIGTFIIIVLLLLMWLSNRKSKKIIQQLNSGHANSTDSRYKMESNQKDYNGREESLTE